MSCGRMRLGRARSPEWAQRGGNHPRLNVNCALWGSRVAGSRGENRGNTNTYERVWPPRRLADGGRKRFE
jgi:hypothetical protein